MTARPLILLVAVLAVLTGCRTTVPQARAPEGVRAAEPPALRVAGYNAWVLPLASLDLRARLRRMPKALAAFDPDVICFQEIWAHEEAIADALPALPHAATAGGGLMVLSRHPIVAQSFVPFPRYAGLSLVERLSGKGVLDVVVRTPRGDVRIVNSHLSLDLDRESVPRRAQLDFLIGRLNARRDLPLVLSADLNTASVYDGARSPEYLSLTHTANLTDAKPPKHLGGEHFDPGPPTRVGWPRTFEAILYEWAPDYLMFRNGADTSVRLELQAFELALHTPQTALSDHNLLVGTWILRGSETP